MQTEVFLVRHCQSHQDAALHHSQWPLSAQGVSQAQALVPLLAPLGIESLYSSPFRRCRDSVSPFAHAEGLPLTIRDDLRERLIAPGIVDGFEAIWTRSWEDFDYAEPGCESSRLAQQRITTQLLEICRSTAHRSIAVSSHGNVIGLLLNTLDDRFQREATERLRNPDVLRLCFEADRFQWDRDFHLPGLDLISTEHAATPVSRLRHAPG